ncbi:hypothetical protein [Nocardioides stalactiti]|uniref:hypothetical protein n=1 Tax=Nocardioides stalactiti TaxID=2755356 RepID=UPI0016008F09|nr:hypothetical protein [Nocardioides stalactiti]
MSSSTAPQLRARLPRIAEVAVQRARLTVVPRPRTRPRAPRVPFVTLVSAIMLAGVLGLLLFNTSMQQASFRASALEDQAMHLTAQEQALRSQLQVLRDPKRIAARAQDRGMVLPTGAACVLDLGSGRVAGTCAGALPDVTIPTDAPGRKRPAFLDPPTVTVADRAASSMVIERPEGRRHGASDRNPQR